MQNEEPYYQGKTVKEWIEDLRSQPSADAIVAVRAFGLPTNTMIPLLIEVLNAKHDNKSGNGYSYKTGKAMIESAQVLAELGPEAKPAIHTLISLLGLSSYEYVEGDEDGWVHLICRIADALGSIGPSAKEAVPYLAEAINRGWNYSSYNIPLRAIHTLGNIGPNAATAVPVIIDWLYGHHFVSSEDAGIVVKALGRIGEAALPDLMRALKDLDKVRRFRAAWALGEIGLGAKEALPLLLAAAQNDKDEAVREKAAWAVKMISAGG